MTLRHLVGNTPQRVFALTNDTGKLGLKLHDDSMLILQVVNNPRTSDWQFWLILSESSRLSLEVAEWLERVRREAVDHGFAANRHAEYARFSSLERSVLVEDIAMGEPPSLYVQGFDSTFASSRLESHMVGSIIDWWIPKQ